MIVEYEDARGSDLVQGNIYKAGPGGGFAGDAISNLFPKLGNQSGFRKKLCENSRGRNINGEWAYVALDATGRPEWPDKIDESTGLLEYYGDQYVLTKDILDTKQQGNKLLKDVFNWLHAGQYDKIPPFFIFKNVEGGTRFLGLAVPGNANIPFGQDLQLAKDTDGNEVNNYLAHFTIIDVADSAITFDWLQSRITDKQHSNELAPKAWRDFVTYGLDGISGNNEVKSVVAIIDEEISDPSLDGESRRAMINVRVNQSVFRNRLLARYDHCCLCGVHDPVLLRASHIKPWADCLPSEKLDVDNGFLLCPNHDRLFDEGYISFEDNGEIIISNEFELSDRIDMGITPDISIQLTAKNKGFLQFHREIVFKH